MSAELEPPEEAKADGEGLSLRHARQSGAGIVMMSKWPEPGLVKTRIGRWVGQVQAARLQMRMLSESVNRLLPYPDVRLAISPDARLADCRRRFPALAAISQGEGDVGDRMSRVAGLVLKERRAVILLGSDSPDLPLRYLEQAITWLQDCDLVLGPSLDGGVYLIGLTSCPQQLFRGIPWSSSGVFKALSTRACQLGLTVRLLPPWRDVDTLVDVVAWQRRRPAKG